MEKFGKYEILEKIGEGGFGVIYRGFDPLIKRTVAIKTCTSEDQEIRNRFFQEAEIAGNLQHRNITIVFDFGIEEEVPYLVQEYLGGEDLDRKIKRRDPMSFGTKLLYLVQVARGLQFAHSRGIIHRDIKPSNIRILDDDTVKIMDFGIAKLAYNDKASLTQTGQTIGTAAYLAPEQIRGEVVDQRADIFAFGLLTYELLTGRRAFAGDNPSSVIYQVLTEQPRPITEYDPDCPTEMIALVDRCLAKDPDERYPDCASLLADLDHLVDFRDDKGAGAAAGKAGGARPGKGKRSGNRPRSLSEATTVRSSPHSTVSVLPRTSIDHLRLRADAPLSGSAPIVTAGAARARRTSGMLGYILLFLFMGMLGAGAWWYWERYLPAQEESREEGGTEIASNASPAAPERESEELETAPPEEATPPASTVEVTGDDPAEQSTAPAPGASGEETAMAAAEPAASEPEPEPPPPPPPPRGTLVLPAAWDGAMTVSINGGRALVLDREHRLQLPPGRYTLNFDLVTRDYDATGETTVVLREGQTRSVSLPIPRPGRIEVRQMPGSPRGWVVAGDDPLGWSPVQQRQLAPGDYQLQIKRGPTDSDEVEISYPVTLHEDRLLIVTFDLRRSTPPTLVERPVRR